MNQREVFSQKIDLLLVLTDESTGGIQSHNRSLIQKIVAEICEITGNTKLYFTFPNLL